MTMRHAMHSLNSETGGALDKCSFEFIMCTTTVNVHLTHDHKTTIQQNVMYGNYTINM